MLPIRLIVMDMDGTLLNSHQQITPENISAIKKAQQHGIHVAISSGRNVADLRMFLIDCGLSDVALLSLNGTYCVTNPGEAPFLSNKLSAETLQEVEEILQREDVFYECYSERMVSVKTCSGNNQHIPWVKYINIDGDPFAPKVTYDEAGLEESRKHGVYKLITEFDTEEAYLRTKASLEALGSLEIASSWKNNLELMPAGHGKGEAILEYASLLGLKREQIMAIGDYDNDLSMIQAAGLGVAMKNSSASILAAADAVTLSNDESGVAYAIYKYALHETEESIFL